nr:map kinase kinase pbs2 [Quercus suber]
MADRGADLSSDGHLLQLGLQQSPLSISAEQRRTRPLPLRTQTELDSCESFDPSVAMQQNGTAHVRHKSTFVPSASLSRKASGRRNSHSPRSPIYTKHSPSIVARMQQASMITEESFRLPEPANSSMPTPPTSPLIARISGDSSDLRELDPPKVKEYDFSKIDYELARARTLGTGLWSKVVLADAAVGSLSTSIISSPSVKPPSPPTTPRKLQAMPSSVFAVKLAARKDAISVFNQEARVLTHLMRQPDANHYVVTFLGQDSRNSALLFEAVIGGSLENLTSRLKQMTELARHLELVSIFPEIAADLISGLAFLHSHNVVHADLKPTNILLDISEHSLFPRPAIRARYIDFSASFRPTHPAEDSTTNAGGTWDFMAPEQMRLQPEFNTPTAASDVWSLGITLVAVLVGDSPYAAACAGNTFLLREAIKSGDPLGFARMEPVAKKRLAAAQDFVDCVRLALQKDRERRPSAETWRNWLETRELGV